MWSIVFSRDTEFGGHCFEAMHVLVAAHDLYPDPGSGGTGRYIYETARRLVERGHRVSVITRRRNDGPRCDSVAGIEVYRYDITIAGRSAPAVLKQLPGARRSVKSHVETLSRAGPPDLVSFQGLITPLLVDQAMPGAVTRITTFHSPWPTEYAIRNEAVSHDALLRRRLNIAIRWLIERRTLVRSDGIITLSEYMYDQLRRVYGANHRVTVVPGGVDTDRFAPDAGNYEPLAGDGLVFLTVRRLMQRMGHDRLLEAFVAVLQDHPDAHLYIAGDGPLRERLERRAKRHGIADRTTFLGHVPEGELPALYASADVFVLPTQQLEGFGLATLEALASATPVVATPVGGTVEVLSDLRERLPCDPLVRGPRTDAIAEGMGEWARLDRDVRERAGQTCRQYVREHCGWEQTVSELLEVYERYR